MEWIWHDGGRAACGFVGQTGDCVTRSIAIATGDVYRDVYNALGELAEKSVRRGLNTSLMRAYLAEHGWARHEPAPASGESHAEPRPPHFRPSHVRPPRARRTRRAAKPAAEEEASVELPRGVVLVEFRSLHAGRSGHLSCVIDHTIYDTWNPFDDASLAVESIWTLAESPSGSNLPQRVPGVRSVSDAARLTQGEYERILKRVKALQRTASNEASTEGEVRNALRAMQALMLQHNLSRNDLVDEGEVRSLGMTRRACPLNGRRSCRWEVALAFYMTEEIFPTVQFYSDNQGHRKLFWFYGPVDDVAQALGLFQEMLLTIATAAKLKYGGYTRGSGASYAEGYVKGLPRAGAATASTAQQKTDQALVFNRTLVVQSAALEWLSLECGIRLRSGGSRYGRNHFDWMAHQHGTQDGARHETPTSQKRLGYRPGS